MNSWWVGVSCTMAQDSEISGVRRCLLNPPVSISEKWDIRVTPLECVHLSFWRGWDRENRVHSFVVPEGITCEEYGQHWKHWTFEKRPRLQAFIHCVLWSTPGNTHQRGSLERGRRPRLTVLEDTMSCL